MHARFRHLMLLLLLLQGLSLLAQPAFNHWLKKKEGAKIEPFMMLQLWSTYSMGQERYNTDTQQYEPLENRFNTQLRRARLGFRAEPYERLQVNIVGAYDLIGRDVNAAPVGDANNGGLPRLGIWDAFVQWNLLPEDQALNLVAGYFRPQLSRESITSGWSVNSMEKAMSQNYIRKHLTGIASGRATGLNIGGLLYEHRIHYNLGVFNPTFPANNGNSTGTRFSPLLVGRVAMHVGDPEMTTYRIAYDINYFGARRGLTLAGGGAWQGATDLFDESYTAAFDFLLNYGSLQLDGEWNFLWREGHQLLPNDDNRYFTNYEGAGHIRAGYNVIINQKYLIEPSFMYMRYMGAMSAEAQRNARAVGAFAGQEYTFDAGLNWYLHQKNLKVMLHYTWQGGDAGAAGPGATVNPHFFQANVGAIQRGNWIGLGLNSIF